MYRFYPSSFLVSGYNTEVKHFKMLTYVEKFQIESFRVSLRKERTSGLLLPRVFVHQSFLRSTALHPGVSVPEGGESPLPASQRAGRLRDPRNALAARPSTPRLPTVLIPAPV